MDYSHDLITFQFKYISISFKVNSKSNHFMIHILMARFDKEFFYVCRRKFHLKISSFSSLSRNPRERRPSIEKLVGHAHHNARFHLKKSSFSSSSPALAILERRNKNRASSQPKTFEPMRLEETPPLLPLRVGERGGAQYTVLVAFQLCFHSYCNRIALLPSWL